MNHANRRDRGFSLIETLVAVAIIGVTVVVFVGGMGTAIVGSTSHRKMAVVQAGIRNFAEAVKAVPFVSDCSTAATAYLNAYSAPVAQNNAASTATNATSHVAPSLSGEARSTLVLFFGLAAGTSLTPPAGTTELWDTASLGATPAGRVTSGAADRKLEVSEPTGQRTAISPVPADSVSRAVLLQAPSPGPVRRGSTSTSTAGAASLTLTKPADTVAGDVMLAHLAVRGADASIVPPTGWNLVATGTSGANLRTATYQRVATTSSPNFYAFSISPNREAAGGIVSYGGVQNGYRASVSSVKWWDGSAFTAACPAPETQALQLVTLRIEATDGKSAQTVEVIKRCTAKPTPTSPCGDV